MNRHRSDFPSSCSHDHRENDPIDNVVWDSILLALLVTIGYFVAVIVMLMECEGC